MPNFNRKRVIVAGGRLFDDGLKLQYILDIMRDDYGEFILLTGMAKGADTLGYEWAKNRGIDIEKHPANWDKYGRGAGFKRNLEMAQAADVLVAFWDGKSKGTRGMIMDAIHEGLELHVYRYKDYEDTTEEEDV